MTLRKPREYLTSEWVAAKLCDACGGLKSFAFLLGYKHLSQAASLTEPGGQRITLDEARKLAIDTGSTVLAHAVAADLGGHFMPGAPSEEGFAELVAHGEEANAALLGDLFRRVRAHEGGAPDAQLLEDIDGVIAAFSAARAKVAA